MVSRTAPFAALLALTPAIGTAQTIPTVDTEDASLGTLAVGRGRIHPVLGIDLRNGDFARGSYDDDAASLDRVPAHLQFGLAVDLHRRSGDADLWLVATSSNGVHAPAPAERAAPRGWYESNNLVALVGKPTRDLTLGAAYTIKTSPNGIADTSHEASLTAALGGDAGLGALNPAAAVTVRSKGDRGIYTQVGVEPQLDLGVGEEAATLSFPALVGIGWGGFYGRGSGDRVHGSIGLAWTRPFTAGNTRWRLRAEALALVRDARLRRIGDLDAETGTVVPYATIGLSMAY